MKTATYPNGQFMLGDCLERMREIESGSVDMILCDLPYGTTACKWDQVIPFSELWPEYWRIAKHNAAVVLFGAEPFSSHMRMSQFEKWRYDWFWAKSMPTGFAFSKSQPMRVIEIASVFYRNQPTYNAQMVPTKINDRKVTPGAKNGGKSYVSGEHSTITNQNDRPQKDMVAPRNLLEIKSVPNSGGHKLHPTQKPVALFEYLVRTYTDEGMVVLDNCAGSGTTAIAAERTGRKWVCIERDPEYFAKACARVDAEVYGDLA